RKAERERLEREELEAKGFVANLERLLVAIDDSANGRFASRLAGLLAGSRGLPTTLLTLSPAKDEETTGDRAEQRVKEVDEDPKRAETKKEDKQETKPDEPAAVHVLVRKHDVPHEEAVAREAKRGYGLLLVGIANTRARNGALHRDVALIAASF